MSEFNKADPTFGGSVLQIGGRSAMRTLQDGQKEVLQDSAKNYDDGRNVPGNSSNERAQSGQEGASQTGSERNDPDSSGGDSGSGGDRGSGGDGGDAGGSDE